MSHRTPMDGRNMLLQQRFQRPASCQSRRAMGMTRQKLIEVALPLEAINKESLHRKQKAPKGWPTSFRCLGTRGRDGG